MNLIKDMSEHSGVQVLSIIVLITGSALDAYNKPEYFSWAAIIIAFILIIIFFDVLRKRKIYETEVLPIPIVVNIDSTESAKYVLKNLFDTLEKNSKFKNLRTNLKRYRNIVEDDLIFTYNGDLYDKERVLSFMQIIKYQITKIKENTPNKVEFHLAYYKRPSYGIFLGYVFEEDDLVIYQSNQDGDYFDKIAELNGRTYKQAVNDFHKFDKEYLLQDETSDELLVGVKASSHEINFQADGLKQYSNVIYLKAKHNGHITLDEDWVQYAREIFTLLNQEQTKFKRITIAHNMPESIGVILGMAIGNHWPLIVTQYDLGDYKEIMRTNEIKCYF